MNDINVYIQMNHFLGLISFISWYVLITLHLANIGFAYFGS